MVTVRTCCLPLAVSDKDQWLGAHLTLLTDFLQFVFHLLKIQRLFGILFSLTCTCLWFSATKMPSRRWKARAYFCYLIWPYSSQTVQFERDYRYQNIAELGISPYLLRKGTLHFKLLRKYSAEIWFIRYNIFVTG